MSTYVVWRVTGTLRSGKSYDTPYDTEEAARALLAQARLADTFADGPHLHKRTITIGDWEAAK